MNPISKPSATLVTSANASLLGIVSGLGEPTLKANVGWVLFKDYNLKYYLIPRSEFKASYPNVVLTTTLLDNK